MNYDDQNIFAKILRGEIPCHRVFEDEHVLCFMDLHPRANGHCLVVPKAPIRNIFDADEASLQNLIIAVQRVAKAAKQAFAADGITIEQFNEAASGQSVFHMHVHIIPRHEGVALAHHMGAMADADALSANAAKLAAAL